MRLAISGSSSISNLTIETYRGTVQELTDFVNQVWTQAYAAKMTFPQWSPEYFTWQLRLQQDPTRENLIATYDGQRLAAVLLGTRFPFNTTTGRQLGSQWSWLSIHADYQGRGIAKLLDEERRRRQSADASPMIVGFRYVGSKHSRAERPRAGVLDQKFNRKIGFWARVLDARRFSKWHWNRLEGVLAQWASPFTRIPSTAGNHPSIRLFTESDLDACVAICQRQFQPLPLAIAWDHDSLRQQLSGHAISQTLVLEEHGQATAFINFHVLPFRARTVEPVAIIDVIAIGTASAQGRSRLLNAALLRMQEQGVVLALKLRSGDVPMWPLLKTHFIPQPADSFLVLQSVSEELDVTNIGKKAPVHLLWR